MCKIISRIKELADNEGVTIGSIEKLIGASKGVLSRAISNGTDIQSKWLMSIVENYPQYSTRWLLTGEGPMMRKDLDLAHHEVQPLSPAGIPLIPAKAMAGFFTGEVVIDESDCERINIPGVKADFAIPVSGDSMTPLYLSGDMVICQFVNLSDMFFQWGKVYIINTNQGVLLKKVRPGDKKNTIKLISENSDYDPIDLPLSDIYQIAMVKGLVRLT